MNQKHTVTVPELGITFSTGSIAQLANGAVNVCVGETNVFVTACVAQTMKPGQDFFPLTVDYRENYAAAGRFPVATSSAKAAPPRRKSSPRASATAPAARSSPRASSMRSRSSASSSPPT